MGHKEKVVRIIKIESQYQSHHTEQQFYLQVATLLYSWTFLRNKIFTDGQSTNVSQFNYRRLLPTVTMLDVPNYIMVLAVHPPPPPPPPPPTTFLASI